jgi:predicted RNA-binding protein with PUA-like domain
VAGIAKVCREGYGDFTSWDSSSKYFDEKSTPDNPRWFMVDIEPIAKFDSIVPLNAVRDEEALSDMLLIRKGQRLSIQPVQENEFKHVCEMGGLDFAQL